MSIGIYRPLLKYGWIFKKFVVENKDELKISLKEIQILRNYKSMFFILFLFDFFPHRCRLDLLRWLIR